MSGIGPVEPAGPVETHTGDDPATPQDAGDHDVIGTDEPRLTDRWHALIAARPRRRSLAAAAVTLARGRMAPDRS